MFAFRPGNFKIFLSVVIIVALVLYWKTGFDEMKIKQKDVSFIQYVQKDASAKYKITLNFIQSLPDRISLAINSDDKVKRGAMNRITEGLELYKTENERYPDKLSQLNADFWNDKTITMAQGGLEYATTEDGQHYILQTPLSNGGKYKLER